MKEILNQFKYNDFIDSLDPTLMNAVYNLEKSGVSLEYIGSEIASMPTSGLTTKSANNWDKSIFQKIVAEVANLVCDDTNESDLVKKLKEESNITTQIIVAGISGYIGDKIGFATALCIPFVILAIAVILKAGYNVFCNTYRS